MNLPASAGSYSVAGRISGMARPIKQLYAEPDVAKELRRRARSTAIGARDKERANIILLQLDGVGVEGVAERLKTTPKRVSLWSRRVAAASRGSRMQRWRVSSPRRHGCRKA